MENIKLNDSDLILTDEGRIYHLNLLPEELASTVILVGDPDRVPLISKHFDRLEVSRQKREFAAHTGLLGKQRVTVLSTGMGVGNIDIALNELDALANIDFATRTVKDNITSLNIIRLGTCGGLIEDIPVDAIVQSDYALGYDGLMSFYQAAWQADEQQLTALARQHFKALTVSQNFYGVAAAESLSSLFSKKFHHGITLTNIGFYGPQYRHLRVPILKQDIFELADSFVFKQLPIANFEMETAAIYGMARVLGHRALSISTILANRKTKTFSSDPKAAVEKMIVAALDVLSG